MNHRQRLEKVLAGEHADRVPVALWRHFPVDDQDPHRLAWSVLNFQTTYDFDLVKVTFSSAYSVQDWGVGDEWKGATEGTREYTSRVVHSPDDWFKLRMLDPRLGSLGAALECLRLVVKSTSPDTPVLATVFSPLSQARKLVGDQEIHVHLRKYPDALVHGLEIITETTIRWVEEAFKTGISGIFFAVQQAQFGLCSLEEYTRFGKPYDIQTLEHSKPGWLNMVHLHGSDIMFDLCSDYPVQILNWHDRETSPGLVEGQSRFPGVVCGGLRRTETMLLGDPVMVGEEAQRSIEETKRKRFILGTGCVIPVTTPHGNIRAARQAVGP